MLKESNVVSQKYSSYKSVLIKYYELVDTNQYDCFQNIFDQDIIYTRCGIPFKGINALIHFYKHERKIIGRHKLSEIFEEQHKLCARGVFEGKDRKNEKVTIRFMDFFVLNERSLIIERETYLAAGFEQTL